MNNRKPPTLLVQFIDLFLFELSNFRWTWRGMLVTGMFAPLTFLVITGFFAQGRGLESISYVLVGNIVLSLMFETLNRLASHFSYIRFAGTLDYFATLPIKRSVLILAAVFAFLLLGLPAIIVTMIGGSLILSIPLRIHPLILVVIPLSAIPLSGLGAFIGTISRTPEEAGSLSTFLTLVMLGLGPVLLPPSQLPPFMQVLGYASPATYAASALRQVIIGPVTSRIILDLGFLTILSWLVFTLVSRHMDWRTR